LLPSIPNYLENDVIDVVNTRATIFRHVARGEAKFDSEWENLTLVNDHGQPEKRVNELLTEAKVVAVDGNLKQIKIRHWSAIFSCEVPSQDGAPPFPVWGSEQWYEHKLDRK